MQTTIARLETPTGQDTYVTYSCNVDGTVYFWRFLKFPNGGLYRMTAVDGLVHSIVDVNAIPFEVWSRNQDMFVKHAQLAKLQ